ncbi:MAG: hypothetical protein U0587_12090 [Candidatus Binatia bacterium]
MDFEWWTSCLEGVISKEGDHQDRGAAHLAREGFVPFRQPPAWGGASGTLPAGYNTIGGTEVPIVNDLVAGLTFAEMFVDIRQTGGRFSRNASRPSPPSSEFQIAAVARSVSSQAPHVTQ